MHQNLQTFLITASTTLSVMVLFTSVRSFADADGDPATDNVPRVVPYDGTIEVDGAGYTGPLDLRFTIYDDADTVLWTETYAPSGDSGASADVYAGRFSVLLGEYVPLAATVLDAEAIFVGVEISTDDFATSTESFTGRQQLGMSPFAIWASGGADFRVAGDLTVDDVARFGDGDLSDGETLLVFNNDRPWRFAQSGEGASAALLLENHSGPNKNFVVQTDGLFRVQGQDGMAAVSVSGGGHTLTAYGAVDARQDLDVGGNADITGTLDAGTTTVDGNLTVTGDITNLTVTSEYIAENDSSGSDGVYTEMVPVTPNSLCFLTRHYAADFENQDNGGCAVTQDQARYRLYATSRDPDGYAYCRARCLTW